MPKPTPKSKPKAKPKSTVRTLRSTDAFVDWAHEVYLSELVLVKATKKAVLVGMRDLEYEGERDRFRVWSLAPVGTNVRWEVEGKLDTDAELTFERADDVAADAKVALRFSAGGTAFLAADAIEAKEEPPKLRRATPRAWQSTFTMWSDDTEITVARLLELVGLPSLRSWDDPPKLADPGWTLASLRDRSHRAWCAIDGQRDCVGVSPIFRGPASPGWTLGIQRRATATDAEWDRAWKLPTLLPVIEIRSRTLQANPATWAKLDWRRAVASKLYG